jgi:hypothetical protein
MSQQGKHCLCSGNVPTEKLTPLFRTHRSVRDIVYQVLLLQICLGVQGSVDQVKRTSLLLECIGGFCATHLVSLHFACTSWHCANQPVRSATLGKDAYV